MFGLGISEIVFLAILALILIGPDDLPKVARQIGRFLNDLKRSTEGFASDLRESAKFDPKKYLDEMDTKAKPSKPTVPADQSHHFDEIPTPGAIQAQHDEYMKHIQTPENSSKSDTDKKQDT